MSMFTVIAVGGLIALWAAVAARLIARHHRLTRYDALLVVFGFGATADLGSVIGVLALPPTLTHLILITSSLPGLLICVEVIRLLVADDDGHARALPHMWTWRAITTVYTLTMIAVIIVGQPQGGTTDTTWQSPTAMATFWVGYGIFHTATCVVMLALTITWIRTLDPGPFRQVIAIAITALIIGIGYGLSLFVVAADGLGLNSGWGKTGYEVGTVQYIFIGAAYLRLRLTRRGSKRSDARALTAVNELAATLAPINPGVRLSTSTTPAAAMTREQLSLACVRAVVEVRDWMHLLAPRLPATSWDAALTAARHHLPGASQRAVTAAATAGWVSAGLAQCPTAVFTPPSTTPTEGADLDADLMLLAETAAVPVDVRTAIADTVVGQVTVRATASI